LLLCAGAKAEESSECLPDDVGATIATGEASTPDAGPAATSAGEAEGDGRVYSFDLVGVEAGNLRDLLERSSLLLTRKDDPPKTAAGLERRVEADVERFRTVLRSEGYFGGEVDSTLDVDAVPASVEVRVSPGEPYTLSVYRIRFVEDALAAPPQVPELDALGLREGERARGADIVEAGARLLKRLRGEGWAFARRIDREIVVDHRTRTVAVDVLIDPDTPARFGRVTVEGLERTEEDYVRQWIPWSRGDRYDESKVDALRKDLSGLGLFDGVEIQPGEEIDEFGELPIAVRIQEGKPRSVGFGLGYSTDRGIGGRVFWRHRNLLGRDEDLELSVNADLLQQSLRAEFVIPHYGRRDRRPHASAEVSRYDTDAFEGIETDVTAGLRWPLSERWSASLGGALEFSDLTDRNTSKTALLFGTPGSVRYKGADDELDPTRGFNFDLFVTPYAGQSDSTPLLFGAAETVLRGYYPLDADRRYVLAGRIGLGSVLGEETADIPANQRLYAGGGASIRGYAFQSVGPLDSLDNPLGGRSKIELGGELRARVWGDFAVVQFVDAGNAYDQTYPDFSEPLQWAAGIGFRYHTPVGPLRFDVAFPINRRDDVDDLFQLYFSIGQAF
jgi:translocation and assembly module TamA